MNLENAFLGGMLAAQLAACSSATMVAPEEEKQSLELLSSAEAPLLVTIPPGTLPLRFRDADNDYFISDRAFTYSVFGKIVAVPGAGAVAPMLRHLK